MQQSLLAPRAVWLATALVAVGRHRFLTARQVGALVGVPFAEVAVVLDALAAERMLTRLRPTQMLGGPEPDAAYALTRRGAGLVARATGSEAPSVPSGRKSLYMLAHELALNELAIVLEVLHAKQRLRLLRWETAREKIAASAHLLERHGSRRVPLVADALAVVESDGKTNALLVEIDRGKIGRASCRERV